MCDHNAILQMRSRMGEVGGRKLSFFDRRFYLKINKPSWCTNQDPLSDLFANQQQLLEQGNIVWGQIVQANNLLFSSGTDDCP